MALLWTDSVLDALRQLGDPTADAAVRALLEKNETAVAAKIFHEMRVNDDIHPATLVPELYEFFEETKALPFDVDMARIARAETVFNEHMFLASLVLLTKSLPEGYQAPNLAIVLNMSGLLRTKTFKRLLGTLELVINVTKGGAFLPGGRAVITAQKLRLLHAGVRHMAGTYSPTYGARYGVPINQEDLIGTILGFSWLVIDGLRTLGAGWTAQEEEDYLYLWCVYGCMMGMHPEGEAPDMKWLPSNVEEAAELYAAYGRRHYTDASVNPEGMALAAANLQMLEAMVPPLLSALGLDALPAVYMRELMGAEACDRLGLDTAGHPLLSFFVEHLRAIVGPLDFLEEKAHHLFAERLFQDMINRDLGGEVTFSIPASIADLQSMIPGAPAA